MDKKVFLAVSLCVGIFLVWQQFYIKPYIEAQKTYVQTTQQVQTVAPAILQSSTVTTTTQIKQNNPRQQVAVETVQLSDDNTSVIISSLGGVVLDQQVHSYKGGKTDYLNPLFKSSKQFNLNTNSSDWTYLAQVPYVVKEKTVQKLVLEYEDAAVKIKRYYQLWPHTFYVDQNIEILFKKQPAPQYIFIEMSAPYETAKVENEKRELFVNKSGGQNSWQVQDLKEMKEDIGEVHWAGFSSRYFLNAMIHMGPGTNPQFQAHLSGNNEVSTSLIYKVMNNNVQIPLRSYFGPKEIDLLKAAHPRLSAAVDFGWFTIIAYPLLQSLKWFYKYIHNFGIAIILLTIFVKILTYPLTYKSMKSMKDMQRIQPQLAKLREKYADDKEKLNREMLQLMKANGYNPMSGCLPMLIQMPVFIALYNVLYSAIELYKQPFFGWIRDLSQKDPYFVTPILLALVMFVQQKMTPSTSPDPAQQKMMTFMPLIFAAMMLWLPSGLTLYMLINSITSIVQQMMINKAFAKTT